MAVDVEVDDATFYFRFLESLTSVWWLQQAMDVPGMLSWLRSQLLLAQKENARLQKVQQTQAYEISKILATRSRSGIRANYTLLLAHFVYTCRRALELARERGNKIIAGFGPGLVRAVRRVSVRKMFQNLRNSRNKRPLIPAREQQASSDDRPVR